MVSQLSGTQAAYGALGKLPGKESVTQTEAKEKAQQSDRISMIKSQIESGEYTIDLDKTAERMALSLLG